MSAKLLNESPFTGIAPTGPDGLFDAAQIERLLTVLHDVERLRSVGTAVEEALPSLEISAR